MQEPVYNGKLVVLLWSRDVDMDEQREVINDFLGSEYEWEQVHTWAYGDGDPGFGVTVGANDPRILRLVDDFGKYEEEGNGAMGSINDTIDLYYQNDEVVALYVCE